MYYRGIYRSTSTTFRLKNFIYLTSWIPDCSKSIEEVLCVDGRWSKIGEDFENKYGYRSFQNTKLSLTIRVNVAWHCESVCTCKSFVSLYCKYQIKSNKTSLEDWQTAIHNTQYLYHQWRHTVFGGLEKWFGVPFPLKSLHLLPAVFTIPSRSRKFFSQIFVREFQRISNQIKVSSILSFRW